MKFKNKNNLTSIILYTILFSLILPILIFTFKFQRDSPKVKDITYLNEVEYSINDGEWHNVTLPYTFTDLNEGTKVSIRTNIYPLQYDGIYVSTTFCKADVYLDSQKVFTLGKLENYPGFMKIPGKEIHVIETYGDGSAMDLKIDYFATAYDNKLKIDVPMLGTSKELILERSLKYGTSWVFSFSQIISGLSIICISFFFLFLDKNGILFTWFGLISVSSGLWFFCSNLFTITAFPQSAWIYLSSYIGFSFCTIPLLRFLSRCVQFENPILLRTIELIYGFLVFSSIILQILGIVPLHKSWYIFRFLGPGCLLLTAVVTIYERIKFKNKQAGKFILPTLILYFSAVGETINRLFFHEILHASSLFQIGTFLFLLIMGINSGVFIKESMNLKKLEEVLDQKKDMLDMMTMEQRERSLTLAKNETLLSRQRHDLRHHLSAIMELSEGNKELEDYISVLIEKIPSKLDRYCENEIVNAIISHYAHLCESENIEFKSLLTVPFKDDTSLNSDLCVIFANMLENAYEACRQTDLKEHRFIDIKSSLNGNLLTITMDNSYNGNVIKVGEKYRSSKRNDFGIGLESVRSIAQQYHGDAVFTNKSKIFYSSVYLSI